MMFRYESRAFQQTAETLQNVCSELDQYEEALRGISLSWARDPDRPAPRERLRRELDRLEERETSLNMLKRKLESAAKLYEAAENRILDLAEEPEGAVASSGDPFSQDIRYGEDSSQIEPKATGYLDFDLSRLAELVWRHINRRRGGYRPYMPLFHILLPGRFLPPHLRPYYPWRYRPHPVPERNPYFPGPPVLPIPRRWPQWHAVFFHGSLNPTKRPDYLPSADLKEAVVTWRAEGSPRTLQPVRIDSVQRQAGRERIERLFRRLG